MGLVFLAAGFSLCNSFKAYCIHLAVTRMTDGELAHAIHYYQLREEKSEPASSNTTCDIYHHPHLSHANKSDYTDVHEAML